MKCAVLLVVAVACGVSAVPQQAPPNLEDISRIPNGEMYALECLLTSGLRIDSLKALQTGDIAVNGDQVKCLVKCFFEKAGFMDGEGKLQQEVIVRQLGQMMGQDQVQKLVDNCNVQGVDACDTAYKATECYFKNKAGLF
uniref:General odorant-binding protein 56d n=2 Tax=Culex pipiens TaxID=7175 RepID=A0A8D8L6X1_CULPI